MILRATRVLGEQSDEKLDSMFGKSEKNQPQKGNVDVLMFDGNESGEEEGFSDRDG